LFFLLAACGAERVPAGPSGGNPPPKDAGSAGGDGGTSADAETTPTDGGVPPADAGEPCGNGLLEPGEACDPGLTSGPGACPTAGSCDDGDPCTADTIEGEACAAVCRHTSRPASRVADQCCPSGADSTTDPDCSSVCGNGLLEAGERCDPGVPSGAGSCPTAPSCDDGLACTADGVELDNQDPCSARCVSREITTPGRADGCCPSGAQPGQDPDCAGCGDGVVGGNETCDTAITSGPNRCPTSADCDDRDACTTDTLIGGGTCMAACTHAPNTSRANGDGCCLEPNATLRSEDLDCPQVPLGYRCDVGSDCTSNRCEAFDAYGGLKGCTAPCDPRAASVGSDCPASSDAALWPLCQSEANVTATGAHNVCTYWDGSPNVAAFLSPGPGLRVPLGTEVRFFALPAYADNVARNWQITLAPNAGLDVVGRMLGPALIEEGTVCNAGGLGQQEVCAVSFGAAQSSQRYWFAVAAMSGSGNFDITLALVP
jgi:hypothetical protein